MRAEASKPVVMVNSCTGKMGRAVAEAATRAGLTVAPYTLCSEAEAGNTVEVAGQQLQLVGPSTRDQVIEQVGVSFCVEWRRGCRCCISANAAANSVQLQLQLQLSYTEWACACLLHQLLCGPCSLSAY